MLLSLVIIFTLNIKFTYHTRWSMNNSITINYSNSHTFKLGTLHLVANMILILNGIFLSYITSLFVIFFAWRSVKCITTNQRSLLTRSNLWTLKERSTNTNQTRSSHQSVYYESAWDNNWTPNFFHL